MRIEKHVLLTMVVFLPCKNLQAQQAIDSLKSHAINTQQSQSEWNILIVLLLSILGVATILLIRYFEKSKLLKKLENKKEEVDNLNRALNETNKQLSELVSTRDHFFSIIAHDLKSPFNSIIGFSEIIAEEARELTTDEVVEYANSIRDSSKSTLILLQNLLDWSRAQTGKMLIDKELFLIKETIEENFRLHKLAAEKKGIKLINNVPKDICANADQSMISAVIRNLVGNAIKFTAKGSVIVEAINIEGFVEVSVSDTGTGILPEHIDKIFRNNTFYTTRGTENERGTGLGLILCSQFVEQNGGKISVESAIGKGSRFVFTIPRS